MYINGGKYQELKAIFDGLAARQTKHSLMICGICRLAPMDILPINTASDGVHWFVQGEKKDAQEPRSTFCRQPRPIPV